MKVTQNKSMTTSKQENSTRKNVQTFIEIGHKAWLRSPEAQSPGRTHEWVLFVCGKDNQECRYVDKVDFWLHETFENPMRVVKEPPFEIHESGYGSFLATITVHFKVKEAPELHTASYFYDLTLPAEGESPIGLSRCEKVTFKSVTMDFVELVLSGGGMIVPDEVAEEALEARQAEYYQMNQMFPLETYVPSVVPLPTTSAKAITSNASLNKAKKFKKQNQSNNSTPTLSNDITSNDKKHTEIPQSRQENNVKKIKLESKPNRATIDSKKNVNDQKNKKRHEPPTNRSTSPSQPPTKKPSPSTNTATSTNSKPVKKTKENLSNESVTKVSNQPQKSSTSSKTNSNVKKSEEIKKEIKEKSVPSGLKAVQLLLKDQGSHKSQTKSKENVSNHAADNKHASNTKKLSQDKKASTKSQIGSIPIASKPVVHLDNTKLHNVNTRHTQSAKNKSNPLNKPVNTTPSLPIETIMEHPSDNSPLTGLSHPSATSAADVYKGTSGLTSKELSYIQEKIMNLKENEVEGLIYLNVYRILKKSSGGLSSSGNDFDLMKVDLQTINRVKECLAM